MVAAPPRHPAASTKPTRAPVLAAPTAAPTPAAPPPTTRTSYLSFIIIPSPPSSVAFRRLFHSPSFDFQASSDPEIGWHCGKLSRAGATEKGACRLFSFRES